MLLVAAIMVATLLAGCGGGNGSELPTTDAPSNDYDNGNGGNDFEPDPNLQPIMLDGVGIPGSRIEHAFEDDIFISHAMIASVTEALGLAFDWNPETDEVTMQGVGGREISFVVGGTEFEVNAEMITVETFNGSPMSVVIDDELFVHVMFLRDVFGAGAAYPEGGHIHINIHAAGEDDMM